MDFAKMDFVLLGLLLSASCFGIVHGTILGTEYITPYSSPVYGSTIPYLAPLAYAPAALSNPSYLQSAYGTTYVPGSSYSSLSPYASDLASSRGSRGGGRSLTILGSGGDAHAGRGVGIGIDGVGIGIGGDAAGGPGFGDAIVDRSRLRATLSSRRSTLVPRRGISGATALIPSQSYLVPSASILPTAGIMAPGSSMIVPAGGVAPIYIGTAKGLGQPIIL